MAIEDTIALILVLGIFATLIAGMWKLFEKADQPGWAVLIPIYNTYVLLKVAGRPGWWLILYIVPIINWVVPLIVLWDVAKNFGKGDGFAVATVLIGLPLIWLGFSDDKYQPRSSDQVLFGDYYDA